MEEGEQCFRIGNIARDAFQKTLFSSKKFFENDLVANIRQLEITNQRTWYKFYSPEETSDFIVSIGKRVFTVEKIAFIIVRG